MSLLIVLWFTGWNMTIDVEQMYNIRTMEGCSFILNTVIEEYGAKKGSCFQGDINQRLSDS